MLPASHLTLNVRGGIVRSYVVFNVILQIIAWVVEQDKIAIMAAPSVRRALSLASRWSHSGPQGYCTSLLAPHFMAWHIPCRQRRDTEAARRMRTGVEGCAEIHRRVVEC